MLFSVILPVYNVEKFIEQCMHSILQQEFTDYECILIDDGSTDGSGAICDDYAQKHSIIKAYHTANAGQSAARNFGLDRAQGDYIIFVDPDDYIKQGYFQAVAEFIDKYKQPDLLVGNFYKYIENEGKFELNSVISIKDYGAGECGIKTLENIYYANKNFPGFMSWSLITKREIIYDNNLCFPEGHIFEDFLWFPKIFQCAKQTFFLSDVYYIYRFNSGSTSNELSLSRSLDMLWVLNEFEAFLSNSLFSDKARKTMRDSIAGFYWWAFQDSITLQDEGLIKALGDNKRFLKIRKLGWKQIPFAVIYCLFGYRPASRFYKSALERKRNKAG